MIIKKKDYEALVADLEYQIKQNHIFQSYFINEYNLRCKLENDNKELGFHHYNSKEATKIFTILNKINSEENEEESDN